MDVQYIDDDVLISNILYEPTTDSIFIFYINYKGLRIAKYSPEDSSFKVQAKIKTIMCTVERFALDAKNGFIVFSATPSCDSDGVVFVTYNPLTNEYTTSPLVNNEAADGVSLLI